MGQGPRHLLLAILCPRASLLEITHAVQQTAPTKVLACEYPASGLLCSLGNTISTSTSGLSFTGTHLCNCMEIDVMWVSLSTGSQRSPVTQGVLDLDVRAWYTQGEFLLFFIQSAIQPRPLTHKISPDAWGSQRHPEYTSGQPWPLPVLQEFRLDQVQSSQRHPIRIFRGFRAFLLHHRFLGLVLMPKGFGDCILCSGLRGIT